MNALLVSRFTVKCYETKVVPYTNIHGIPHLLYIDLTEEQLWLNLQQINTSNKSNFRGNSL